MEAFLEALDELIDSHAEDLTGVELIGALQLAQHRIALNLLAYDSEDNNGEA
jgi:hypothetical protein